MKLEVKELTVNIVSTYAPQVSTRTEEKNDFWQNLDELIGSVSKQERIVLGAEQNGHVVEGNIGYEEIMRRYGAGTRNKKGLMVVDFAKSKDLAVFNTCFKKKHDDGVTQKVADKVPK